MLSQTIENKQNQEKVLGLLLMRFKITPSQSVNMTKEWINKHPDESWQNLETSLRNGLIKVENGKLIDLYSPEITKLVNQMRGKNGLEIKDRDYHFKTYKNCFIGSEAVKWLRLTGQINREKAIELGQDLINLKLIHHVTDDHKFKDEYLFYRFYIDE